MLYRQWESISTEAVVSAGRDNIALTIQTGKIGLLCNQDL